MDLFDVPAVRPSSNHGDSLIDEPSSMSGDEIYVDSNLSEMSDSLYYSEQTGKREDFLITESNNTNSVQGFNESEEHETKGIETSKFLNISQKLSQNTEKKEMQFIEYTEFSTRKASKAHEFDETRYEIVGNMSTDKHLNEDKLSLESQSRDLGSPTRHMETGKKDQRNIRLNLTAVKKNPEKNAKTDRRELNITAPLVISPDPQSFSQRLSFEGSRRFHQRSIGSCLNEMDILQDDQIAARKRIQFLNSEVEKARQRILYLTNEIAQNEKANFIEQSQKLSQNNYEKMKLEVLEIKNENLERENEGLREAYFRIMRCEGRSSEKREKGVEFSKKNRCEERTGERDKLEEEKDKIELELRKSGISSQRRAILREKLAELKGKILSK